MINWENSCVGCPSMGLPCQGTSCRNYYDYPVLVCDVCHEEVDELWEDDGVQMCADCLAEHAMEVFEKVEVDEDERRM
ncbi:MAG: hypothetical protein LUD72_06980 [Bacteroidales bacterium]|nr:hypothetical protein [Bacteroidales bacterium]